MTMNTALTGHVRATATGEEFRLVEGGPLDGLWESVPWTGGFLRCHALPAWQLAEFGELVPVAESPTH